MLSASQFTSARLNVACPGPVGPVGPRGLSGNTGPTGRNGSTGASGPSGPQGIQGSTGAQGPSGPSGPQGATGPQGSTGPQGFTGAQGEGLTIKARITISTTSTDPSVNTTVINNALTTQASGYSPVPRDNIYITFTDLTFVYYFINSVWTPIGQITAQSIQGPSGPQGATGPEGATFMTLTKVGAGTNATLTSPTSISSNGTGSTIFVSSQTVNTSNSGIVIEFTPSSSFYQSSSNEILSGFQLVGDNPATETNSYGIYIVGNANPTGWNAQFRVNGGVVGGNRSLFGLSLPIRWSIRTTPTRVIFSYVTNDGTTLTDDTTIITHGTNRMTARVNGNSAYTLDNIRFYGVLYGSPGAQGVTGPSGAQGPAGPTGPEGAAIMTLTRDSGTSAQLITPTSILANGTGETIFYTSESVITETSSINLQFSLSSGFYTSSQNKEVQVFIEKIGGSAANYSIFTNFGISTDTLQFRQQTNVLNSFEHPSTVTLNSNGVYSIQTTSTAVIYRYTNTSTGATITESKPNLLVPGTYRMKILVYNDSPASFNINNIRFYGSAYGPQGPEGLQGPTGPQGATFMTFTKDAGSSAVLTNPTTISNVVGQAGGTNFYSDQTIDVTQFGINMQFSLSSGFYVSASLNKSVNMMLERVDGSISSSYDILLETGSGDQFIYFRRNGANIYSVNNTVALGSAILNSNVLYSIKTTATSAIFNATNTLSSISKTETLSLTPGIYRLKMAITNNSSSPLWTANNIRFYGTPLGPGFMFTIQNI